MEMKKKESQEDKDELENLGILPVLSKVKAIYMYLTFFFFFLVYDVLLNRSFQSTQSLLAQSNVKDSTPLSIAPQPTTTTTAPIAVQRKPLSPRSASMPWVVAAREKAARQEAVRLQLQQQQQHLQQMRQQQQQQMKQQQQQPLLAKPILQKHQPVNASSSASMFKPATSFLSSGSHHPGMSSLNMLIRQGMMASKQNSVSPGQKQPEGPSPTLRHSASPASSVESASSSSSISSSTNSSSSSASSTSTSSSSSSSSSATTIEPILRSESVELSSSPLLAAPQDRSTYTTRFVFEQKEFLLLL